MAQFVRRHGRFRSKSQLLELLFVSSSLLGLRFVTFLPLSFSPVACHGACRNGPLAWMATSKPATIPAKFTKVKSIACLSIDGFMPKFTLCPGGSSVRLPGSLGNRILARARIDIFAEVAMKGHVRSRSFLRRRANWLSGFAFQALPSILGKWPFEKGRSGSGTERRRTTWLCRRRERKKPPTRRSKSHLRRSLRRFVPWE